jgi:hypothetical protein
MVKEVSSNTYPQLARTNHEGWSLFMKVKLEACSLSEAVEFGDVHAQAGKRWSSKGQDW